MKLKLSILIILILLTIPFLPIQKYRELNHLKLIHSIKINCQKNQYNVILKEIIPEKKDNSITYKYYTYNGRGKSLPKIKKELEKSIKEKFYYNSVRRLETNCSNKEEILKIFSLNPKKLKIESK